jgi:Protein of unknown function (DUF3237)
VNLSHEGLSLWYGTADAPAPEEDGVLPRRGASLVVGVQPANPTNSVSVRFRLDGGAVRTVPGRELRTDYQKRAQYFVVSFPAFPTGSVVEYSPQLSCAGRQVPAPHLAERFPSRFRLAAHQAPMAQRAKAREPGPAGLRFPARLDFVASVAVQFDEFQFVGDTPAGMRVNFIVREGTVLGDGFRAHVTHGSSDHMIIRPDGMGVVRIRAAFATEDAAILDVESGGYVDFGPDGYRRALAQDLPDRSPLVLSPLIYTRHPKYRWLNRVQCVAAGETHLDVGQASYHVYSAVPRDIPATR